MKDLRKVALTREGQDGSNLGRAVIGVDQHVFGGLQLLAADILTDGGTDLLFEQAGEIALVQMDLLRQLMHRDAGMKMTVNIIQALRDLYGTDRVFS